MNNLEERLFTGKEAASMVGMDPSVLTAWAMRGVITPIRAELVSIRRKNFRYDMSNILEIAIKKKLSDCLSIKYDMLEMLTSEAFGQKRELLESALKMEAPCLFITARTIRNKNSANFTPDLIFIEGKRKVYVEAKLSSWRPEFVEKILESDLTLVVNIGQIREQLFRNA